jgi:transcription termination factor Rho
MALCRRTWHSFSTIILSNAVTHESYLGVLDVLDNGAGFVRRREAGYLPHRGDIYVGKNLIQKFGLRKGDEIAGEVGKPGRRGKNKRVTHLLEVNGEPPESIVRRPQFNSLRVLHPDEQLVLECELIRRGQKDYTNRIIDLFCPFGKGQRTLIVAPAKAGKTMVLQAVAQGVVTNYPDCHVMILLVDERPEEVTEMENCGFGEVVASSFDYPPDRHVAVVEMTLERARRKVEQGQDVVIILDSITRLARTYNTVEEGSGRTLTGGLDATSLDKPKKFLGSARKIDPAQGGGSLTIIGTALIDTGSRMDQVIFEEFKGTGNSELVLSRELADRRIYPSFDLTVSSTRREELLLSEGALRVSSALRRGLSEITAVDAMNTVLGYMQDTDSNVDLEKLF